jgi:hypothetical protein
MTMTHLLEAVDQNRRYSLEEFVELTNSLLPRLLPQAGEPGRRSEEVTGRLVRNLTTLALLDETLREGREARYTYRHLLQLLVTRQMMARGLTTTAVREIIHGMRDSDLETLLSREGRVMLPQEHEATDAVLQGMEISEEHLVSSEAAKSRSRRSSNSALDYLRGVKARTQESEPGSTARRVQTNKSCGVAAQSTTDASVSYRRLRVREGLELHVSSEFQMPDTQHGREVLAEELLEVLAEADRTNGSRKRRR